jgi:hypothetical protein
MVAGITIVKNSNFRKFALAYLECALWSSTAHGAPDMEEDDDTSMESYGYGADDIEPKEILKALRDCRDFYRSNLELLDESGDAFEQHGHDFWLTRNHHGAGFWDRGYPSKIGNGLTQNAHAYGERNLYVGDDGQIYGF